MLNNDVRKSLSNPIINFQAANLSSRLTSLQSETRCQMSNAEAARMILEKKMKEQEADLKTENSWKASEIVTLSNEMEAAKGDLKKIREEAKQQAEQLGKLQINKRLVMGSIYLNLIIYLLVDLRRTISRLE